MNFETEFRKAKKDYAAANNQVEDLEEVLLLCCGFCYFY